MSKAKVLPLAAIKRLGPCREQYRRVRREWPDGVPLTLATLRRANELALDWRWLAHFFLAPGRPRRTYFAIKDMADKERWHAIEAADQARDRAIDQAKTRYQRAGDEARAYRIYDRACIRARDAYQRERDRIYARWLRVVSRAALEAIRAQLDEQA